MKKSIDGIIDFMMINERSLLEGMKYEPVLLLEFDSKIESYVELMGVNYSANTCYFEEDKRIMSTRIYSDVNKETIIELAYLRDGNKDYDYDLDFNYDLDFIKIKKVRRVHGYNFQSISFDLQVSRFCIGTHGITIYFLVYKHKTLLNRKDSDSFHMEYKLSNWGYMNHLCTSWKKYVEDHYEELLKERVV